MKAFHFKNKVDSLPESIDRIMAPIQIRIKPTNVCNHNCCYCSYRANNLQVGRGMVIKDQIPREKMIEILDDIIEMEAKSVTFSGGGEPFCYPHLLEAVKKLSQSRVKFAALTNGAKLQGELAELFAYHGTWIRISIDGWDDESYSFYRGVPNGEFTKVMKNMENFKKLEGKCFLGVTIIVDKNNALHIYEFIKQLKNIGINTVKLSPCVISDSHTENDFYHKPIFEKVQEQTAKAINDFSNSTFQISNSYRKLDEKFKKKYTWCPYIQISPVIGADLNIYSCHTKAYNLDEGIIGSIKNRRFKDLWFLDKSKFFKINPSRHCNHYCVEVAKNMLILEYLNADKGHLEFV